MNKFQTTKAAGLKKPHFEVADVFAAYGREYLKNHRLSFEQSRIMTDIEWCRTMKMGGHSSKCSDCDYIDISYNSCRNRHCPKCGALNKARWLEARQNDLLPAKYFHVVFTLPHELNPLIMVNRKPLLNALFRVVRNTLNSFCLNPRYGLEGQLGYTAVLHTWDQKLNPHYHLHLIVPAGVYQPETAKWKDSKYNFLFPVKAMSIVFRSKMVGCLRRMYKQDDFKFVGRILGLSAPKSFSALLDTVMEKPWVVYAKRPFKSPKFVLDYLGRYTHRVAISNNRIKGIGKGQVSFTFRHRCRTGDTQIRTCKLKADQFIQRFLYHELPKGFMRIRHFGFLSNAKKHCTLTLIRRSMMAEPPTEKPSKKTAAELMVQFTGIDITRCPKCGGRLEKIREFDGISSRHRYFSPLKKAG